MKFKLKGKSYKLPTSWKEVPLYKYMEILKIDKDLTDNEKRVELISILCNVPIEFVKEIKISDLKMIENILSFINRDDDYKLMEKIKINGKSYYLQTHLDDMLMEEFTDLETLSKPDKYIENLHHIMAILYREEKKIDKNILKKLICYIYKRKDIVNHDVNFDERSNLFKQYMTVDVLKSALIFFSILRIGLINRSLGYSTPEVKEKIDQLLQQVKKYLPVNGDGTALYME